MITEIYTRNINDPYYDDFLIEHNNDIEAILSQIRLILSTRKGDVLGDYNFGVGIEDLIFATKYNKDKIRRLIQDQLNKYIDNFPNYDIKVDVSFFKQNDENDGGLIDVYINQKKIQGYLIN